jgi:hypothetical protein
VRSAVYFPDAGFSNSIKSVGPALCPDFTYDDLTEIADGAAASAAFLSWRQALSPTTLPDSANTVFETTGLYRISNSGQGRRWARKPLRHVPRPTSPRRRTRLQQYQRSWSAAHHSGCGFQQD